MIRATLLTALLLASPAWAQAGRAAGDGAPLDPGAAPAALQDAGPASDAPRGETALARRLSDSVAVRIGPQQIERVLYYFSPTAELAAGDELEQGSGGHSEVGLPEGGRVELHATAHLIIQALGLAPEADPFGLGGDVLVFPLLTKARITSLTRPLAVVVPGGAQVRFQGSEIEVHTEPGRIIVRNRGGVLVEVLGLLSLERGKAEDRGVGRIVLERGQEVALPLFRLLPVGRGVETSEWNRLTLRHSGGWEFEPATFAIRAGRPAQPEPLASDAAARPLDDLTVAGVRTRARPGETLLLSNWRREVPEPLLSLGDYEPAEEKGAGLPIDPDFLLNAVREGITLERLRVEGYEISDTVYAKAQAYVAKEAARAAGTEAAEAPADDAADTPPDTEDESTEGNQP